MNLPVKKRGIQQKRWNALERKVEDAVDALGHPIDAKIAPLVIGLWANGIPTSASCEGHLKEEGRPYPWVMIEVSPPHSWGRFETWKDDERKRKVMYQKNIRACVKLLTLLKSFYTTRSPSYEVQLILSDVNVYWGHCELMSLASPLSMPDRKTNLRRAQVEMDAFAVFLKKRFFEKSKN